MARAAVVTGVVVSLAFGVPQDVTAATTAVVVPGDVTAPSINRVKAPNATHRQQIDPAAAVHEIRKLARLTWQELADLFQVSRRSVHNWAGGEAISADHQHKIYLCLSLIRRLNNEAPAAVRELLLAPNGVGPSLFHHIKHGSHEQANFIIENLPHDGSARLPKLAEVTLPSTRPTAMQLLDRAEDTAPPSYKLRRTTKVGKRGK